MGFTVQSILKRIPIAIAPIIGGLVIVRAGLVPGVRALLVATLVLSVMTLMSLFRVRIDRIEGHPADIRGGRGLPSRHMKMFQVLTTHNVQTPDGGSAAEGVAAVA